MRTARKSEYLLNIPDNFYTIVELSEESYQDHPPGKFSATESIRRGKAQYAKLEGAQKRSPKTLIFNDPETDFSKCEVDPLRRKFILHQLVQEGFDIYAYHAGELYRLTHRDIATRLHEFKASETESILRELATTQLKKPYDQVKVLDTQSLTGLLTEEKWIASDDFDVARTQNGSPLLFELNNFCSEEKISFLISSFAQNTLPIPSDLDLKKINISLFGSVSLNMLNNLLLLQGLSDEQKERFQLAPIEELIFDLSSDKSSPQGPYASYVDVLTKNVTQQFTFISFEGNISHFLGVNRQIKKLKLEGKYKTAFIDPSLLDSIEFLELAEIKEPCGSEKSIIRAKNLKELTFTAEYMDSISELDHFSLDCPRLKKVKFVGLYRLGVRKSPGVENGYITVKKLNQFLGESGSLEEIVISHSRIISESHNENPMLSVKTLTLDGAISTSEALITFISQSPNLQTLKLSTC